MSDKRAPLRFKLPYSTEEEFLAKFGASLARGGVFVATKAPRPEGAILAFEFVLGDGSRVLAGEGKVVASQPPGPETPRPGMILRFTRLDPESRSRIDRALALREGARTAAPPSPAPDAAGPAADVKPLCAAPDAEAEDVAVAPAAGAEPHAAAVPDAAPEPEPEPEPAPKAAVAPKLPIPEPPAPARATRSAAPDPVLGIDLGTSHCRAAVWRDGQAALLALDGAATALPSLLAADSQGSLVAGEDARNRLLALPSSALSGPKCLLGLRAKSAKLERVRTRLAQELASDPSGELSACIGDRTFSAVRLVAALLSEIRLRASAALGGRPLSRAVVCAPPHFDGRQRQALRQACELAGLRLERILSEPAAVGVAYGHGKGIARKRLLVCDFGGGSFGASVLEATGDEFELISSAGELVGGLDFDRRVADALARRIGELHPDVALEDPAFAQRLRAAAEEAKIALSDAAETRVRLPGPSRSGGAPAELDLPFDRAGLESLTGDLVQRALAVVRAALETRQLSPLAIDAVLLVGGQSRMPLLRAELERLFPGRLQPGPDAFDAVARGAALVGRAMRDEDPDAFPLSLREVLTAPIGLATRDGGFSRLLERDTPLPCEKTCTLPLGPDGGARVALFQGESARAAENAFLGSLELRAPGPAAAETGLVLSVSADGLLALRVRGADGAEAALALAEAELSEAELAALFAAAPHGGERGGVERGLVRGLRRLFARK